VQQEQHQQQDLHGSFAGPEPAGRPCQSIVRGSRRLSSLLIGRIVDRVGRPYADVLYLPLTGAPPAVLHYVRPRTNPHPHAANPAEALRDAERPVLQSA
jgi:hypothetical protein